MSAYQTFVNDLDALAAYIHNNSETHELDLMSTYDVDTLKHVLQQNQVSCLSLLTNRHGRVEALSVQNRYLSGNEKRGKITSL